MTVEEELASGKKGGGGYVESILATTLILAGARASGFLQNNRRCTASVSAFFLADTLGAGLCVARQ